MFDTFDREWRFMRNNDGSITRGRLFQLPEVWTADTWRNYWDGDMMVAFTVSWRMGRREVQVQTDDNAEAERAVRAWDFALAFGSDPDAALTKVAQRIENHVEARFVHVSLDRDTDIYALSYDGDPKGEWVSEIQAVWNGEVYRIECEDYEPDLGWQPSDEYPEEFYGTDKSEAEWERVFPMTEFPAEQFVDATN